MIWITKNYKGEPMTWYSYDEVLELFEKIEFLKRELDQIGRDNPLLQDKIDNILDNISYKQSK